MVNLINVNPKKHNKDCCDWVPLKDGTKTCDQKYCDLSTLCRQLGMKTDWYHFYNHETREYDFDYFCTGMEITEENKKDDDEVS
jgi:hypothetical protein